MTTLSTHDTKRGEDVRARIGVLSQVPSLWSEFVARWETTTPAPDPATGLFLFQNIFGVWPASGEVTGELRTRLHAYSEKAIREAALHTSWQDPDTDFERAVHDWLDAVLDGPVARELTNLVIRLQPHAENDALGQKLLSLTVPGIPDIYQGTELWDDSLVDPDNRRPVNYEVRRQALKSLQHRKIRVVKAGLQLRRARPDTFLRGGYRPVLSAGGAADHVVAFVRGDDVLVAATRWTVHLEPSGWGATVVGIPEGRWANTLTGAMVTGTTPATELFAELPVALLERTDG
jgi:(1->4)-alpha-D-glucan 1-alpha-D-glucosylmutase